MFYSILDTVILNISTRFEAAKNIVDIFSVLWRFLSLEDIEIEEQANCLQNHYVAINSQFKEEIKHLKSIFSANFLDTEVAPLSLLNKIHKLKLDSLSALGLFCTLPVTVAQAERSFSYLSRIKNVLRSTMGQERLSALGILAMESRLARNCDFSKIIENFASAKCRKAPLK